MVVLREREEEEEEEGGGGGCDNVTHLQKKHPHLQNPPVSASKSINGTRVTVGAIVWWRDVKCSTLQTHLRSGCRCTGPRSAFVLGRRSSIFCFYSVFCCHLVWLACRTVMDDLFPASQRFRLKQNNEARLRFPRFLQAKPLELFMSLKFHMITFMIISDQLSCM